MPYLEWKEIADIRNKKMREMLLGLEETRDALLDELAAKKGQVQILEQIIKEMYESILEINKECQANDIMEAAKKADQDRFSTAAKGVKTPKRTTRKKKNAKD